MDNKTQTFNRKSIRLKNYDYSQVGYYFITLCCQNKKHLFGEIENNKMDLNNAGHIARDCWFQIPKHFKNTKLHNFVIMPNHVHGIVEITQIKQEDQKTIGSIVRGYKTGVTKWFRQNCIDQFPIGKPVWQRNYWEHVIRNQNSFNEIAEYINNNPLTWEKDELNQK